jgi:hypothetical protein
MARGPQRIGMTRRPALFAPAALATLTAMAAVLLGACATAQSPAVTSPTRSAAAPEPATAASDSDDDTDDDATDDSANDANGTNGASGTNDDTHRAAEPSGPCPADMALVASGERRFCVDKYEDSLVEVLADGTEKPFPHYVPVDGHDVRAVSRPHAFPQGYISEVQAQDACAASHKRLCNMDEWKTACMGPSHTTFPYGDTRRPGACHDTGKSAVIAVFGAKAVAASTPYSPSPSSSLSSSSAKPAHSTKGRAAQSSRPRATAAKSTTASKSGGKASSKKLSHRNSAKKGAASRRPSNVDPGVWAKLNDPGLGQVDGALARTGEHAECVNGFGVFDMVGNLHEWVATDPNAPHGTFAGGYYLDTTLNGDGCNYRTVAHAHDYHDYSTGFRCCGTPE